ncbi:MAG: DUF4080 domain-containing protein [Clostridia bacterium]
MICWKNMVMCFRNHPPYEILSSRYLSYDDLAASEKG